MTERNPRNDAPARSEVGTNPSTESFDERLALRTDAVNVEPPDDGDT